MVIHALNDIPIKDTLEIESEFIDSVLLKNEKFKKLHEERCFKPYCFDGLYPLGENGRRKKDTIYTMTIRTVSKELKYFFEQELSSHSTKTLKGLVTATKVKAFFSNKSKTSTDAINRVENRKNVSKRTKFVLALKEQLKNEFSVHDRKGVYAYTQKIMFI